MAALSPLVHTREPWFSEIIAGRKTVEARPGRREYPAAIVLVCGATFVPARVVSIAHYDTLDDYLAGEGWMAVAPHTGSYDEARAAYLAITADGRAIYASGPVTALRLQL